MAAPKGLNPKARAYVPLSHQTYTPLTPNFSAPTPHFPPPPPHFAAPTNAFAIRPPPPPPVAAQPPHAVAPRSRPRFYGGRGRRRELGFRHQPNFGQRGNSGNNNSNNNDDNSDQGRLKMHRKNERRALLRKHDVLPLSLREEKTTVMIKNIPKEYNYESLLKFLDEHCMLENSKNKEKKGGDDLEAGDDTVSAFDFMYLPVDFRSGYSRGFAFVNFTEAGAVWRFYEACNGKRWDMFESPKIREIVCAMIQGKEAMVRHFEKSTFRCDSDEFLPVCFSPPRDGSGKVAQETRIGRRI